MPRSKRPDKTCNNLIIPNSELAPRLHPTNTWPKPLDINTIRIDNNLLRRHTTRLQIPALDIGDDKNTRRSVKVQSLVSLQQFETPDAIPVAAHPNLRAVVLEEQRPLRAIRGHHTGPAKPRVPLINEIGIGLLEQRHRAAREDEVIVNVEKRARAAAGLRWNHSEAIVRGVHAGDEIVADDLHLDTKRFESFNHAFDV